MTEGLGLRLGGRRCGQSSLRLGGGGSGREKLDLLADGTAEVTESLLDVGWVVIGLVVVLRGDGEQLLMHLLQSIDPLLKVDVVRRELGLRVSVSTRIPVMPHSRTHTLSSAWPSCSLVYWKVRDAKGVSCELKLLQMARLVTALDSSWQ